MTVVSQRIDTLTGRTALSLSMSERIAHDHPTIETVGARIGRHGGTRRPEIRVETRLECETDTLVRLVLADTEYRARVERTDSESTVFRHAASTPRLARNPDQSENAIVEWVSDRDLTAGRSIHVDIVEPGFRYGLRAPGEKAVYDSGKPRDSLTDIARGLDP